MKTLPAELDGQPIRRVYDEGTETWWFSVIDVVPVLTQQSDDLTRGDRSQRPAARSGQVPEVAEVAQGGKGSQDREADAGQQAVQEGVGYSATLLTPSHQEPPVVDDATAPGWGHGKQLCAPRPAH